MSRTLPDWRKAMRKAFDTPHHRLDRAKWHRSPAYQLFVAEAQGKAAADWANTAFVGMARGHARMAAHAAFNACPELREA